MAHKKEIVYYAKSGEFVTLDNKPYAGPFHKVRSGILMSGDTHTKESQVIVSTANRQTKPSPLRNETTPNTELDENQTQYDLLPELINSPPVIIKSISEASTPSVKPSGAAGLLEGEYMYQFPDGTVKVHAGAAITLAIDADQPKIFNVENGLLEIKEPEEDLSYRWFVDGELIVSNDVEYSLRAERILNGNSLIITKMIPKYMGIYTCVASNDVGSVDGGSLNIEVYNSDFDSFFYTNLITNPNGKLEDGSYGLQGWESTLGNMKSAEISKKTEGKRDKRLVVDPMKPDFRWTTEMLHPRPYQLDGGVLQKNPLQSIDSYFTRTKYQYRQNGGTGLTQMYQDIDISDLKDFVNGSIYGVSGVTALISFYLGNAIYNYEPARPYLTSDKRANKNNYWPGAARVSPQNFSKIGPGFVKEIASVQIEEYYYDARLPSKTSNGLLSYNDPITVKDPWNRRFSQYKNKIYYEGGQGLLLPDNPSQGGRVDEHLFVADELMPKQADRYAYGQYAEFNRISIPTLNPATNKIRIIYTIQAAGVLEFVLQESNTLNISDGILEAPSWAGSWPANALSRTSNAPNEEDKPFKAAELDYRTSLGDFSALTNPFQYVEQKIPKQSTSRAFATGFNLTLIPTGPAQNNQSAINSVFSKNTKVIGLVPSPFDPVISTAFTPTNKSVRDVTIGFVMNTSTNQMHIQMTSIKDNEPTTSLRQELFAPGLVPFDIDSNTTYLNNPTPLGYTLSDTRLSSAVVDYTQGDFLNTSGPIQPIYLSPGDGDDRYTQMDSADYSFGGTRIGGTNRITAPIGTQRFYTINRLDRITLYQNINKAPKFKTTPNQTYQLWATPFNPLEVQNLEEFYKKSFNTQFTKSINKSEAQWKSSSRYIITLGVHNTNYEKSQDQSLYAIDNYYLDFIENEVKIHKDKNTAKNAILPSLDTFEQLTQTELAEKSNIPKEERQIQFNSNDEGNLPNGATEVFSAMKAEEVVMVPISVPINDIVNDNNSIASFDLSQDLLTRPRMEGGLNIPIISPTSASIEVVEGSSELFSKAVASNMNTYKFNLDKITTAINVQISSEAAKLDAQSELNFFNNYNYTLPYDDLEQTQPLPITSVFTGSADEFVELSTSELLNLESQLSRSPIPEDSLLMVFGRRRDALQRSYENIITTRELSIGIPDQVEIEKNISPTSASILTDNTAIADPMYKVILYGVRPAIASTSLNNPNEIIGTPIKGFVDGNEFKVQSITVGNTGSIL